MIERKPTIDIKILTLKEPKAKSNLVFDAERDVTDSYWSKILDFQSGFLTRNDWSYYAELSAYMSLLFPKRRNEFLREPNTRKLLFEMFDPEDPKYDDNNQPNVSDIKLLYPETTKEKLEEMGYYAEEARFDGLKMVDSDLVFLSEDLFEFLVVYPERKEDVAEIPNTYSMLHSGILEWEEQNFSYTQPMFLLQYLYPDKPSPIELTGQKLRDLRDLILDDIFSHASQGTTGALDASEFIQDVRELVFLKFLTAEHVEIKQNGIEVKMPGEEKFENKIDKIPEKRRF
jgi:hypothetical protein